MVKHVSMLCCQGQGQLLQQWFAASISTLLGLLLTTPQLFLWSLKCFPFDVRMLETSRNGNTMQLGNHPPSSFSQHLAGSSGTRLPVALRKVAHRWCNALAWLAFELPLLIRTRSYTQRGWHGAEGFRVLRVTGKPNLCFLILWIWRNCYLLSR